MSLTANSWVEDYFSVLVRARRGIESCAARCTVA